MVELSQLLDTILNILMNNVKKHRQMSMFFISHIIQHIQIFDKQFHDSPAKSNIK